MDVAGAVGREDDDRRLDGARTCRARGRSPRTRRGTRAGTPRTRRRPGRPRRSAAPAGGRRRGERRAAAGGGRGTLGSRARPRSTAPPPDASTGPQVQQLAAVVPLVDGLGQVDALVALQPEQLAARPPDRALATSVLPTPGLALEQQRAVQPQRQEDRRRQPLVGQVSLGLEASGHVVDGRRQESRSAVRPASSRARRTRTVARCRRNSVLALRSAGGSRPSDGVGGGRSAADAPPATAASTARGPQGHRAHVDQRDPTAGWRADRGDADDGPVLGPAVELLERPARRRPSWAAGSR